MTCENHSRVTEFVLLGFTSNPDMQVSLFVLFLAIYSVTLLGNFLIVTVTSVDPALQTPMYFFLRNLSLLEVCFTLVMVPKMLVDLVSTRKVISFVACGTQMYFFFFFGSSECFLLSMMAYDRFVAICNPLRYSVIMNRSLPVFVYGHRFLAVWCSCVHASDSLDDGSSFLWAQFCRPLFL